MYEYFCQNIQPFSCSNDSKFRLAPEHCAGGAIFEQLNEPSNLEWREWKPASPCISQSCMIPAKGIRIFTRLCNASLTNISPQSTSKEREKNCNGIETSLQICSDTHNLAKCSKLVTPSQFASNKCSQFQVYVSMKI